MAAHPQSRGSPCHAEQVCSSAQALGTLVLQEAVAWLLSLSHQILQVQHPGAEGRATNPHLL